MQLYKEHRTSSKPHLKLNHDSPCNFSGWGETVCPTDVKDSVHREFPSCSLCSGLDQPFHCGRKGLCVPHCVTPWRLQFVCRRVHFTRDFSHALCTCDQGAQSVHPHVIHDVTCLSVCCLFVSPFSISLTSTFSSFTVYLFSVLHNFHNVVTAEG